MFASWLSTWLAWSSGFAFFAGDCFSAEPLFAASFVEEAVAFESAVVVPDGFASLDFVVALLLDSFVADAFVLSTVVLSAALERLSVFSVLFPPPHAAKARVKRKALEISPIFFIRIPPCFPYPYCTLIMCIRHLFVFRSKLV